MTNQILLEAIACKKCVVATYNRTRMTLAPHILYTKNDALYVDAVTLARDGRKPTKMKLGSFNLAGLKDISLEQAYFRHDRLFDPSLLRYAGATLFAIA